MFLSYKQTHVLTTKTDHSSPSAARRRLRWAIFFAGWTVFASLAVWWLVRRAESADPGTSWFFEGDAAANASFAERIGNWLKLVDLNFHGIYPWILLAPYVAWLGARFHLERGHWRMSLPAHLAGCALFVVACRGLATYNDWGRQVVVAFSTPIRTVSAGTNEPPGRTGLSNEFAISMNGTTVSSHAQPRALGGGAASQRILAGPDGEPRGGGEDWPAPGPPGIRSEFFVRRRLLANPLVMLDPLAYAFLVGIVHTVHFYRRSREREGRAAALEAQLTQARLHALQAQLHPHFLFNALNAISTLLRRDTRAAQDALASFSELLRLALCQSTEAEVTLRDDLEFLRRYVEIQQTRLGDRLRFEEVVAPEALDCLVPTLFLQPLVENAIRHGIEPSCNGGWVRVIVQPHGERLLVTVEDNGAGLSNKHNGRDGGMGIGLRNLRSRLESLYGAGQKIDFGPRPEGGVIVQVEFPLRQAQPAETAAGAP